MVYLRIRSPSSAVQDKTITLFQALYKGHPPAIDHIQIFGCTTHVFDETKSKPNLASKTWTGNLVGYKGHHQYRIYYPSRQAVYIREDVMIDENVVGPTKALPTLNTLGNTDSVDLLFPTVSLPLIPWLNEEDKIVQISDPGIFTDVPTAGSSLQAGNWDTSSELSDPPDDSDEEIPTKSDKSNTAAPVQQKSARRRTRPTLDYQKISQGKAANAKTHLSVPHNSPHLKASQTLFHYSLTNTPPQASQDFVRIAPKGKHSTPDWTSLKEAMRSPEASEWKGVMKREFDALIENGTWKLVDRPIDQHVLTAKWVFKRKQDIDSNIKRYKARWIAREFEQRDGVDYFETFATVVKPQTNKCLFAMTAKKNLHSHKVDMITAFLNSCLGEKVQIKQPLYFDNGNKNQVLLLLQRL